MPSNSLGMLLASVNPAMIKRGNVAGGWNSEVNN